MNIFIAVCLFLLAYPIVIYPLLLSVGGIFQASPRLPDPEAASGPKPNEGTSLPLPSISMLLSVYNEEAVLHGKIVNFLDLNYPPELLELIVISDGSTDASDDVVRGHASPRIRLLRQEGRLGKTRALNMAVSEAKGDILLFTDADAMLRRDCPRRLAAAFADPDIGLASGRSLYLDEQGQETTGSLYRRYEEYLKEMEGWLYGIAGADGAVYALRRELYTPLPPEYINDLVHPVQVALAGKKSVAVPEALVTEPASETSSSTELARQTRIMAQSWLIFFRHGMALIRTGRWGFFWQFVSHKVLRWLALPFLLLATMASLVTPGFLSGLTLAGVLCLLGLAACGAMGKTGRLCRIAWLFLLQATAAMLGLNRLLRGNLFVTWNPRGN